MSFRSLTQLAYCCLAIAILLLPATSDVAAAEITKAVKNEQGILVHEVTSRYQASTTKIKVLLPTGLKKGERCRVLYVLPVEAGEGNRYGDGLLECLRHKLHNKHRLICVMPTFSHLPWYADHPTNERIRQENYFLKIALPFVEKTYPAKSSAQGRLLVGFSKSGWGAYSMLLRHPDVFSRAAAWDAPLTMTSPGLYGNKPIFETQENFDQYRIELLLERQRKQLTDSSRLVLTGYDAFRKHHQQLHEKMTKLGILHQYRDGPHRKHTWHSGWLPEAVQLLVDE